MARRAAARRPDLVSPQRTQGLACYQAGLIDEACAALERAVSLPGESTSPTPWVQHSLVRTRGKDLRRARQDLERATRRLSEPDCRSFLGPA